jgi:hypothetical protein
MKFVGIRTPPMCPEDAFEYVFCLELNGGLPMRRLSIAIIAAASTIALTQMASAADLPRKAPVYVPPPPVADWSGVYVALEGGYGWGHQSKMAPLAMSLISPKPTSICMALPRNRSFFSPMLASAL